MPAGEDKHATSESTLPTTLLQKCFVLVEQCERTSRRRTLPKRIASRRNAVALALVLLRAAGSAYKVRVFLWPLAVVSLVLGLRFTWWFALASAAVIILEHFVAAKERGFWTGLATML